MESTEIELVKTDLVQASSLAGKLKLDNGEYPQDDTVFSKGDDITFTYVRSYSGKNYCLGAVSSRVADKPYYISSSTDIAKEGVCPSEIDEADASSTDASPKYYVPPGAGATSKPVSPSLAADGVSVSLLGRWGTYITGAPLWVGRFALPLALVQ